MKAKTVKLSFELAEQMDKSDNSLLKELALNAFPKLGLSVIDRIKNAEDPMQEVFEITGVNPSNYKARTEEDVAPMALKKLRLAQKVLVGDWTPDWNNDSQYKYYPFFDMSASGFAFNDYVYYFLLLRWLPPLLSNKRIS